MAAYQAVHRTILVFDIEQSNHPLRTNHDRVVIREAMYKPLSGPSAGRTG